MIDVGLLGELAKVVDVLDGDLLQIAKHEGGEAVAKLVVKKKRKRILRVYTEARESGRSEQEACLTACRDLIGGIL